MIPLEDKPQCTHHKDAVSAAVSGLGPGGSEASLLLLHAQAGQQDEGALQDGPHRGLAASSGTNQHDTVAHQDLAVQLLDLVHLRGPVLQALVPDGHGDGFLQHITLPNVFTVQTDSQCIHTM